MNFLKKLFGSDKNKSSKTQNKVEIKVKQETKPDISLLKCSSCKKEYIIGKNAVAVCLESVKIPGSSVIVVYDDDERVDLVAPIDSSNIEAFERAKLGWKTIQESLSKGQQRKWKCNLCNNVNSYPELYSALIEPNNQYSSTNELDPKPDLIVHTYPNSKAQRLLGLSADNMLSQTYLSTSGRYIIEELGEIGSPDALRFLNEILVSKIYGKEIKGHAKRALNIHNKKTQGIQDNNTEVDATNNADDHIKRGYARYCQNDYMGAISDYSKAIEIDPKNEEAFYYRGYARNELNDYEGALQDFDKVIELNDKYSGIYNNRGIAKDRLMNYSGAIEDYTKAIEINSKDANAYYNRGYDKYRFKDYLGAIEDYTKALEINPKLDYIKKDIENAKKAQQDNIKYTYKCDNCSKESNDSGGYAFYSDVPMMGNMLFCKACTDQIITEYSFAAPRKYSGSFDLFSLKGNQLNEINAEAIIARCKKFGLTPSQAKQKAKELGLEFHKDNKYGQDLIYEFWRSK